MYFNKISVHGVRNLIEQKLAFSSGLNCICGPNGSGKSSLLEAIYLVGTGRSFRAPCLRDVVNFDSDHLLIASTLQDNLRDASHRVGLQKKRLSGLELRLDSEDTSIAELASLLPMQLLNTTSFDILEAGPNNRRQFIDWMVFHVEHDYLMRWRRYNRILKQRNQALKQGYCTNPWDEELATLGESITSSRLAVLNDWQETFEMSLADMNLNYRIVFSYKQGWSTKENLLSALKANITSDQRRYYTENGPHRADLQVHCDSNMAKNILSRGQLKKLICSMLLARSRYIRQKSQKQGCLLVDDIGSELDEPATKNLLNCLQDSGQQVFLTAISQKTMCPVKDSIQMFHVEHGVIRPLD